MADPEPIPQEPDNSTVDLPLKYTATDDGYWRTIRMGEMLHPDDKAGDDWGHAG